MSQDNGTALMDTSAAGTGAPQWVVLVDNSSAPRLQPRLPTVGRVVGRFVLANLIAVALLISGSMWASGVAAKDEAIAEARHAIDMLAGLLVQPVLDGQLSAGDPAGVTALDSVLQGRLDAVDVLRVKIWNADGTILYSDEPRLIGNHYDLDDEELEVLRNGGSAAGLSDLTRPENRFERSAGQLLEVYRHIESPSGQPLLLETYSSYADAAARQVDIWRAFAPISVGVLLALLAMQLPLAHRMVVQLQATSRERELLQARALDASTEERRRIAGSLHDGIVQDVSASALLVAGVADRLREKEAGAPAPAVTDDLDQAARALRDSAGSLRSLLVEIYPPNLERAGLSSALADLAARLRPRGIDVRITVPERLDLPLGTATLLFRTAQEALLNVAKHAGARNVRGVVRQTAGSVVLEITDDGNGFDLGASVRRPRAGHLGLSVLSDLAAADGATLSIRTAPGAGTSIRLEVPRP